VKKIQRLVLAAVLASGFCAVAQQTRWSDGFGEPSYKPISPREQLSNGAKNQWAETAQIRKISAAGVALPEEASLNAHAEAEIEHVLHAQQDSWNRHDLDAFMTGYWNSPDLTFFSGAKESRGWQATIDRYKATYTSPGHEMGKLDFSELRVEILGPESAFVRGVWQLTMSDGKTPHGRFTLIFRKFPEGWKIIHDHTSAAE
jgi:ketosteroid isomerase-like protein